MYKIIFADDEALVRNSIQKLIDWDNLGFELLYCCENGHELLEMVDKLNPDVVITDINMPFISGIDVAKEIRSNYPNIKIVFLTGYNDFEYAQVAVELKIMKYILKPVTAMNISQTLSELKIALDNECLKYKQVAKIENFYEENKNTVENIFLENLILSKMSESEITKKTNDFDIQWLKGQNFIICALAEDGNKDKDEWEGVSSSQTAYAIYNIAKEMVEESRLGSAILSDNRIVLFFSNFVPDYSYETFEKHVYFKINEIRSTVKQYLNFTISAGVGRTYNRTSNIYNSHDEAIYALSYRQILGQDKSIYFDDVENSNHNSIFSDKQNDFEFINAIRYSDKPSIVSIVDHILLPFGKNHDESYRIYIVDLLISLIKESEKIGIDNKSILKMCDINSAMISTNKENLRKMITDISFLIADTLSENKQKSYSKAVTSALKYINDNYKKIDLSIDDVCGYLHFSASYFRTLFKKELDTTFVSYITKIRMEHAKEFIKTTQLKNYEIAEAVGYSDPHYFSYCFKRYFNVSPSECREQNKM